MRRKTVESSIGNRDRMNERKGICMRAWGIGDARCAGARTDMSELLEVLKVWKLRGEMGETEMFVEMR